jgi:hypothetical protein
VKYELGFYIPEDDILYSDHRGNLKSYNTKIDFGEMGRGCVDRIGERGNEPLDSIKFWEVHQLLEQAVAPRG